MGMPGRRSTRALSAPSLPCSCWPSGCPARPGRRPDGQRHARARRRRPAPALRGRPPAQRRPRALSGGPVRERRVRHRLRGHPACTRRTRWPAPCATSSPSRSSFDGAAPLRRRRGACGQERRPGPGARPRAGQWARRRPTGTRWPPSCPPPWQVGRCTRSTRPSSTCAPVGSSGWRRSRAGVTRAGVGAAGQLRRPWRTWPGSETPASSRPVPTSPSTCRPRPRRRSAVPPAPRLDGARRAAPEVLVLEVTETAIRRDPTSATGLLRRVRDRGVAVAMDDFGTGDSSLGAPAGPAVVGPEDRPQLRRRHRRPAGRAGHRRVDLARAVDVAAVAEGVETADQAALLRRLGCGTAQGWLWGAAVPVETLLEGRGWAELSGGVRADRGGTRSRRPWPETTLTASRTAARGGPP